MQASPHPTGTQTGSGHHGNSVQEVDVVAWDGSTRSSRLPPGWRGEIVPRILDRDQRRCRIQLPGCTGVATEVDHKRAGDDHRDANLQAACSWCHGKKSSAEGNAARRRWSERRPAERHPGLL